jgi:CheY-like chemotaxis protein
MMEAGPAPRWLPSGCADRLLVVEEDAFAREALAQLLRGHGYPTETAADVRRALLRLRQGPPPALVLLALEPPGRYIWHFCERRRREPRLARIPVVAVSAADALPPAKAAALGVAGHLPKPVVLGDLLDVIARCCGRG